MRSFNFFLKSIYFLCLIVLCACSNYKAERAPDQTGSVPEEQTAVDTSATALPEDPTAGGSPDLSPAPPPPPPPPPVPQSIKLPERKPTSSMPPTEENFVKIPIFYGTDRNINDVKNVNKYFGKDFSEKMSLGILQVTIPKVHKVGEMERPPFWRIWDRENPKEFVTLWSVEALSEAIFYQKMKETVQSAAQNDAFVFIHGFNNTFAEAARRAGQLTHDLGFKGLSILYSWPSDGSEFNYDSDGRDIRKTTQHLKAFLTNIVKKAKPSKLHIIAHSMGNRALVQSLKELADENKTVQFNQVILAAPDVDKKVFEKDILPHIGKMAQRFTLYTSDKDVALIASKIKNRGPRLGLSPAFYEGLQTVDVSSSACGDVLFHGCFSQSKPIMDDILKLFENNADPTQRRLKAKQRYWILGD
jgi:esterase/lipase superfamily enzyme